MEIKKKQIYNSRFFYLPHTGKASNWSVTLGKLLNKMEIETPYISANSYMEIFPLGPLVLVVGKEVIGPIRGDLKGIYLEDFPAGEILAGEIYDEEMTFVSVFRKAQETVAKNTYLRDIFSIRIDQRDPFMKPMELRFFPKDYPIPKLTI